MSDCRLAGNLNSTRSKVIFSLLALDRTTDNCQKIDVGIFLRNFNINSVGGLFADFLLTSKKLP